MKKGGVIVIPAKTWRDAKGRTLHRLGELPAGTSFRFPGKEGTFEVHTKARYTGGSVYCKSGEEFKSFRYYSKVLVCST